MLKIKKIIKIKKKKCCNLLFLLHCPTITVLDKSRNLLFVPLMCRKHVWRKVTNIWKITFEVLFATSTSSTWTSSTFELAVTWNNCSNWKQLFQLGADFFYFYFVWRYWKIFPIHFSNFVFFLPFFFPSDLLIFLQQKFQRI